MKKLSILFIALMATVTSLAQRETSAGSTKANADFNKYRTYTWAQPDPTAVGPAGYEIYYYEFTPDRPDPRIKISPSEARPYFYSYRAVIPAREAATNDVIQTSIANELEGRGYRENEPSADLLVVYQVFEQKAVLHGYVDNSVSLTPGRDPVESFELEPGTLMISLIDAKTSQVVWNGFASGMVNERAFTSDEADLKQAVHTIFEKFRHTADKAKR